MDTKDRDKWGVIEATHMLTNREITRETWLEDCFPPWGQYINYQMENTTAEAGKIYLWWFGGPSWGIKHGEEIFLLDNYAGPSIVTRYENSGDCQNTGADYLHWMRLNPCAARLFFPAKRWKACVYLLPPRAATRACATTFRFWAALP